MRIVWEPSDQSRAIELLTGGVDFSLFTLRELFTARHWIDSSGNTARRFSLENEIQKRCAYIRRRIDRKPSALAKSAGQFKPRGFIIGLIALFSSIGPFLAVNFIDMINFSHDPSVDTLKLSGVWAVVTSPFAALAFFLGGIRDAGHAVRWFNLVGRSAAGRNRVRQRAVLQRGLLAALRLR